MSQVLKIDDIDRSIIEIVQKEPNLTHTEIAKKINRSQPTVGMRIRKLEESGVLKFQAGINLKTADLVLARVELETKNPAAIENLVKKCPFMLNGFRQSGDFNFSIFIVGFQLTQLEFIVNTHFRNNPDVQRVDLNIITSCCNDFVLPFNLNYQGCGEESCKYICCGKCID